jgi:hypothetical protein
VAEFLSLRDAVARYVRPGSRVALEGFTHLIPFAAGHEIIRQGITDLTLIRMTPDLIYDQSNSRSCDCIPASPWSGCGSGWPVKVRASLEETPAPRAEELAALRDLQQRTRRAHGTDDDRH